MEELFQFLCYGVVQGSVYALIAVGYTMIFSILRMINFAHGEFFMIGAYVAYFLFSKSMLPLPIVLIITGVTTGVFAMGLEKLLYSPIRKYDRSATLLTAVGASIFLQYSGQKLFGAAPREMPERVHDEVFTFGNLILTKIQIGSFLLTIVLLGVFWLVIYKTRFGLAMRATSFRHDVTGLMGINVNQVISSVFFVGGFSAGLAGALIGIYYNSIDPMMGMVPGIKAFTAAVVGGIGNLPGAVLGAFVLGIVENLTVGFVGGSLKDIVTFSVLILVLLIRPRGLLGNKVIQEKL